MNGKRGRPTPHLWRTGLRAGMVAAIVNMSLFRFGYDWGVFPGLPILPKQTNELTLLPLLAASLCATLAGTAIYRLLSVRLQRPLYVMVIITLVSVLLASFGPVAMSSWTDRQVMFVNGMHVIVAISTVTALWHWEQVRFSSHYA